MAGCIWHRSTPAQRKAVSELGVIANKIKRTLPNLVIGDLATDEGILGTLQGLTEATAKDKDVDLRRVSEIRQGLNVAVSLRQTAATRELNRTLLRLEHGERAVVLLEQLKGSRPVRPLPSMPNKEARASGQ
jgi:hypothetical protein